MGWENKIFGCRKISHLKNGTGLKLCSEADFEALKNNNL